MLEMRFLVDAQLPPALARFIDQQGYEAKAARDVGLREADDNEIWSFAHNGNWIVITKDEDFVQRALQNSTAPQVVWLRIRNSTNSVLLAWFEPLFKHTIRELKNGQRVVELRKLKW